MKRKNFKLVDTDENNFNICVCNVVVDSNLQVRVVFQSLFRISKSYKFQQQLSQFYACLDLLMSN